METLLTLKQVQEILQVDRTTIHRMLKDGRLTGVKVGGQWRFAPQVIEELTRGAARDTDDEGEWGEDVIPLFCVQRIQDVFAEISGVGAVVTDLKGQPLTQMSNLCEFCRLIQSVPTGKEACQNSWRQIGLAQPGPAKFLKCHAGLEYARAVIEVDGKPIAALVSGQFHSEAPGEEFEQSLEELAHKHNLPPDELKIAAQSVKVLDKNYEEQIGQWLEKIARTFSDVSNERARLLSRLRQIAEITLDVEGGTLSHLVR